MLVLFLLQPAALPLSAGEALRFESSAGAMGSIFSIVLYGEDRAKLETAAEDAFGEVRRLDNLLSNYKPDSEWSRLNREGADHPVMVSRELFDLLQSCIEYSARSEGAFDISVGPLMKIWGFYKGSGHVPQPGEVKEAMSQTGYRYIQLDSATHTVTFARKGLNLDPGGIGKGYAVDRMAEVLQKDGLRAALISGGGSSIYCLGTPPGKPGWTIGIEDPREPARMAAEVTLRDTSLSTSGSFEKFFVAEGKTWSHIMDPRTGYPSRGVLSVSIIAPRTLDSEAWAKPYFINGRQWTASHKPREQRVFLCEDKADQPCAWLP